MKHSEVALVLAKCAAYDSRTIGEADVLAWHEAIGDLNFEDSKAAVIAWYRNESERIMPANVRAGVKTIRNARLEHCPPDRELMSGIDPDLPGAEWARIYRERRKMIADGMSPTELRAIAGGRS